MSTNVAATSVAWLDEIAADAVEIGGGKGANLGELAHAGFTVPPGFVVTAEAYRETMEQAGVTADLGVAPSVDASIASADLQRVVRRAGISNELRAAITDAYSTLCARVGREHVPVAVRSSAVGEDAADASYAGMNRTLTNIVGADAVVAAVVVCWESLFGERAVAYRAAKGHGAAPAIAVVVQAMVTAARSGVAFSTDPTGRHADSVVVEAVFGQGEAIVSGAVEPDTYVASRDLRSVIDVRIGTKELEILPGTSGDETVPVDAARQRTRVLDDAEVLEVAALALAVEDHYGCPQDVEWCYDDVGRLHIVQARPITTLPGVVRPATDAEPAGSVLVSGLGASPGVVSGVVRMLRSPAEGSTLRDGEVLVAPMTNPDWLPTLRRAAAIVTDQGGITCHAAIVSRELGVPCVVGTRRATALLSTGQEVTVDGARGTVSPGRTAPLSISAPAVAAGVGPAGALVTATRLYVNLAIPERAEAVAAMPVDGVGLLRAERRC